jgi:hypothetical protein
VQNGTFNFCSARGVMKLPRRRFLQLATAAVAFPASRSIATAQTPNANAFSFSVSLGGPRGFRTAFTSAPAVCSWGPTRLDVFGRGEDNALWHRWLTGREWSDWESLGGTLTAPPAAVSWGEGRIDVFVRGTDLALWHKWFTDGEWSDWESLGGLLNFGPAVSSWGPRRLDVFARGTDNTIFQRTFDNGWHDWTSIAELETTVGLPGIAAVSSARGKIDLFTWGATHVNNEGVSINFLQHKSFRGVWKPTQTLGLTGGAQASLNTSLTVASWMTDRLDWFVRTDERTLEHTAGVTDADGRLGTRPSTPIELVNLLTSGPAAVARPGGGNWIDLISRGQDNTLWHTVIMPSPGGRICCDILKVQ